MNAATKSRPVSKSQSQRAEKLRRPIRDSASLKRQADYDQLAAKLVLIEDRVRSVHFRESTGLYIHGRAGVSKSYTIEKTLEELGSHKTPSFTGHMAPLGLYETLEQYNDSVVVLDDLNALFNNPISLNILLAALGQLADNETQGRWIHYRTASEDKKFKFTGGIIGISNLALDGHHKDVLRALKDRVPVLNFSPTDDEVVALIFRIAQSGVIAAGRDTVPPDEAGPVADFLIAECSERSVRPSVRMFVDKAIADYRLWRAGHATLHWTELVSGMVQEALLDQRAEWRNPTKAEEIDQQFKVLSALLQETDDVQEQIRLFRDRTGRSRSTFYRLTGILRQELENAVAKERADK